LGIWKGGLTEGRGERSATTTRCNHPSQKTRRIDPMHNQRSNNTLVAKPPGERRMMKKETLSLIQEHMQKKIENIESIEHVQEIQLHKASSSKMQGAKYL
jgi:uncharacterized protein YnzC (UPF0291/DUF896 family)